MKKIILLFLSATFSIISFAQGSSCAKHISSEYIIDPQHYATAITFGETESFKITFIGGNTYRIAVESSTPNNLLFYIYDQENNLLFSNSNFENSPFWDFEIPNTMECTIKVSLASEKIIDDFANICIGFKKQNL